MCVCVYLNVCIYVHTYTYITETEHDTWVQNLIHILNKKHKTYKTLFLSLHQCSYEVTERSAASCALPSWSMRVTVSTASLPMPVRWLTVLLMVLSFCSLAVFHGHYFALLKDIASVSRVNLGWLEIKDSIDLWIALNYKKYFINNSLTKMRTLFLSICEFKAEQHSTKK